MDKEEIRSRIFRLLSEKGVDQKDFAKQIGTTDKTVSAWKTGRVDSFASMKWLPKIAEVLGTSMEYLVSGEEKKPIPMNGDGLSPVKRELLEAVDGLSDEQCRKLLGIIVEAKKLL